jgi:hypothetical protein
MVRHHRHLPRIARRRESLGASVFRVQRVSRVASLSYQESRAPFRKLPPKHLTFGPSWSGRRPPECVPANTESVGVQQLSVLHMAERYVSCRRPSSRRRIAVSVHGNSIATVTHSYPRCVTTSDFDVSSTASSRSGDMRSASPHQERTHIRGHERTRGVPRG